MKERNTTEKDTIGWNPIPLHQCEQQYQELWTRREVIIIMAGNYVNVTQDELLLIILNFKNERTTGRGDTNK